MNTHQNIFQWFTKYIYILQINTQIKNLYIHFTYYSPEERLFCN